MTTLSYKRLLVKFSGEAVAGEDEHGIDPKILDQMAASVKDCRDLGAEIGIVIGGGNLLQRLPFDLIFWDQCHVHLAQQQLLH